MRKYSDWNILAYRQSNFLTLEQFGGSPENEDNTAAWHAMMAEYATGKYSHIQIGEGTYLIPNHTTVKLAKGITRFYGTPNKSFLKFWKEDVAEPCPVIFNKNDIDGFYSQDVIWLHPETWRNTEDAKAYNLFTGRPQGNQDKSKAPCIALVNTVPNEKLNTFGFGDLSFSGNLDLTNLLEEPAYGNIYMENYRVKGIGFTTFNANRCGGGVYWETKNCYFETGDQRQYATNQADFKAILCQTPNETIKIKTDSHKRFWPQMEGFSSRSAVFQVYGKDGDVFSFIITNNHMAKSYLQQVNGRAANNDAVYETDDTRYLCGNIPKAGDVITMQREYETGMTLEELDRMSANIPDMSKADYSCEKEQPALRSHICWTTVEQKHGTQLTGIHQNGQYLQAGDVVEHIETGTQHTVKYKKRGYFTTRYGGTQCGYPYEYQTFANQQEADASGLDHWGMNPQAYIYENYIFEPPLPQPETPTPQNSLVQLKVIKSRAAYLLDGGTFDASFLWMQNAFWSQSENKPIGAASSVRMHSFYNMDMNHNHQGTIFKDVYYRQNNMNYVQVGGQKFMITDPDTGEEIEVFSKAAYTYWGSQHVNTEVAGGQYGNGYDAHFPVLDKLLRGNGIEQGYKAMQRNIGKVTKDGKPFGQHVVDPFYTTTEQRTQPEALTRFLIGNRL